MRRSIFTVLLLTLALAGCGGGHDTTITITTPQASSAPPAAAVAPQTPSRSLSQHLCPAGQAYMGCSVLPSASVPQSPLRGSVAGAKFPDVSIWQGHVDWGAVAAWQRAHGWPTGGIFKMGEYTTDSRAADNSAGTRSLSWRAGYWFVRNTGCQHEADQIAAGARAYGLKVVWLDAEVPEARGYGQCLSPLLRKVGLLVGEYTAPGTNPGGLDTSDPLWEATFGSGFTPIWHPVVAWQCTDGASGCVTDVPGIGRDDVNIDLGISKLAGPPVVVDPYRRYDKTVRSFKVKSGTVKASEYNTVKTFDGYRGAHKTARACVKPFRRSVCISSANHLGLLIGRDQFIAGHKLVKGRWVAVSPPRYNVNELGSRLAGMRARA